jgi:hypothetical protein
MTSNWVAKQELADRPMTGRCGGQDAVPDDSARNDDRAIVVQLRSGWTVSTSH